MFSQPDLSRKEICMVKLKSTYYYSVGININTGWYISKTNWLSGDLKGEEKVGRLSCRGRVFSMVLKS